MHACMDRGGVGADRASQATESDCLQWNNKIDKPAIQQPLLTAIHQYREGVATYEHTGKLYIKGPIGHPNFTLFPKFLAGKILWG